MATYHETPTYEQARHALDETGDPFTGLQDQSVQVPLTYQHHRHGERNVEVDPRALSSCDVVYADETMTDILYEHGAREVAPLEEAVEVIDGFLTNDPQELIWSVSGFATAGNRYIEEGRAMDALFTELAFRGRLPELVVDGGSRTGVLGLSAYIARERGVSTLGFTPLQGLDSMAPHDHLIVGGETYRDREKLVGSAADIITVWGGRDGTEREIIRAADCQSTIFFMNGREYTEEDVPQTFYRHEALRDAYEDGRLVVYNHGSDDLSAKLDEVVTAAQANPISRAIRRAAFPGLLRKTVRKS